MASFGVVGVLWRHFVWLVWCSSTTHIQPTYRLISITCTKPPSNPHPTTRPTSMLPFEHHQITIKSPFKHHKTPVKSPFKHNKTSYRYLKNHSTNDHPAVQLQHPSPTDTTKLNTKPVPQTPSSLNNSTTTVLSKPHHHPLSLQSPSPPIQPSIPNTSHPSLQSPPP